MTTCSLSGRRRTGGGRRCASWSTCGISSLVTGVSSILTTGSATVLIAGLTNGLAALSSNLDHSLNADIASRLGRFHSDNIPEIARIPETDARGLVRGQLGCVARCHPPTHIILA